MRILLKGYYGWSNLGDDLLMLTSFRAAQQKWPNANISVWCAGPDADLVSAFLGREVEVVTPQRGQRIHYDLIVHGGGGTFFDYQDGDFRHLTLNQLIKQLSPERFVRLRSRLFRLLGKAELTTRYRLGWGIGIGGFTPSSRKWASAVSDLQDFQQLFVRDPESLQVYKSLQLNRPSQVLLGTDLAFHRKAWLPKLHKSDLETTETERSIGLVFRDAPHLETTDQALELVQFGHALEKRGFHVKAYSFCPWGDRLCGEAMGKHFDFRSWSCDQKILPGFLESLATNRLLVTSRAHAAILGACLGVPSLIMEIESKLRTVHHMLPNCSWLIPKSTSEQQLVDNVIAMCQKNYEHGLRQDITNNERAALEMISASSTFLGLK